MRPGIPRHGDPRRSKARPGTGANGEPSGPFEYLDSVAWTGSNEASSPSHPRARHRGGRAFATGADHGRRPAEGPSRLPFALPYRARATTSATMTAIQTTTDDTASPGSLTRKSRAPTSTIPTAPATSASLPSRRRMFAAFRSARDLVRAFAFDDESDDSVRKCTGEVTGTALEVSTYRYLSFQRVGTEISTNTSPCCKKHSPSRNSSIVHSGYSLPPMTSRPVSGFVDG